MLCPTRQKIDLSTTCDVERVCLTISMFNRAWGDKKKINQQKEKKMFWKREKMHLSIIWIEKIPLLQVHFSQFIAKQGTIVKDICYILGALFCFLPSSSCLIYYEHANWPFRRQRPCAVCFIIIMWYKVISCNI